MSKLLVICGPTGTGKTKLALSLAKRYNGELVSADSRQVYVGMDIGTGKDKPADGTKIWVYDVTRPDQEFSVSHYQKLAKAAIEDIQKKGKLPIIVGGTGFYIQSVINPIETIDIPPNPKLRTLLTKLSVEGLQKQLRDVAPDEWNTMNNSDRLNPRRLIRKIEICQHGYNHDEKHTSYDYLMVGLTAPYPFLYRCIDERVDERVRQGIQDEIAVLLAKGYSWDLPSLNTLGYIEWKDADKNTDEIIQSWKYHEHAYARRQMSWFKKQPDIHWFDISAPGYVQLIEELVGFWYNKTYEPD